MNVKDQIRLALFEKAYSAVTIRRFAVSEQFIVEAPQMPKLITQSGDKFIPTNVAAFLAHFKQIELEPAEAKQMRKAIAARIEKVEDKVDPYSSPMSFGKEKGKGSGKNEKYKAILAGLNNKEKALSNYISWLEDRENEKIEKGNETKSKIRDGIDSIVDTMSGGNPLAATIVRALANRIIADKQRVNYTSDDEE